MNKAVKERVVSLIEQYFHSLPNNTDHIAIKKDDLNQFLSDFSEIVISRTLDTAFGVK